MLKILFVLVCLPICLSAQNDSMLLLVPERLTERDILPRDLSKKKILASSATRSLEAVDDLPFTVVVVSAAEILRNGYVTLTDVLKAVPGIQVSQPGNVLEGETFMVRGLSGNQYMKILINDVPIKPMMSLGMPIGAQLPIRQAERIEILLGPAAAIYGDETCAGVINIILKESERPVYTQADLGFGRYGYNSLDLMFGGKIGKDKKIFRFSLYGSSTVRDETDLFYNDNLYNTNSYLPFGLQPRLYEQLPNFRASAGAINDSFPRLNQIPHESRLFGINLTWRGLHFTYHRMQRFDHSAIGLNPLAVGYANPSNRIAERIETFSVGFQRTRKRRTSFTNLSFQRYSVDKSSTTTQVFDQLSTAAFVSAGGLQLPDSLRYPLALKVYQRYNADERFMSATGVDSRIESRMSVRIGKRKRVQFDAGGQANIGLGTPLYAHYSAPVELAIDGPVSPFPTQVVHVEDLGQSNFNFMGFTQLAWHSKKLHVIGGGSASARLGEGVTLAPRLGILYHLDSTWALRTNFATGIRHSSAFGNAFGYRTDPADSIRFFPSQNTAQTERNYAFEGAIRYHPAGGGSLEGIVFWQQAYNLSRPGYLIQDATNNAYYYGFQQAPGLALSSWGVQSVLRTGTGKINLKISGKKDIPLATHFDLFLQYARGREWFGYGLPSTDEVRNQPKWNTQFRFYFAAGKKIEWILTANSQRSRLSKMAIFYEQYERDAVPRLDRFRTWDFMARLYLSNHFLVYFQMTNMFNQRYGGLDATGTPDDLLFNPQQGRQWRLGVNYNMN